MNETEPRIVAFLCNWCSYAALDKASSAKKECPPGIQFVRVMCSGRVEPQLVVKAFHEGADGVIILGCHPGDCHYKEGNYKTLKRYHLLRKTLKGFGIEEERLVLDWVSATEPDKLVRVLSESVEKVKALTLRK
jgi:F420-non-reducing hydrogenase iron-sulfur subunit